MFVCPVLSSQHINANHIDMHPTLTQQGESASGIAHLFGIIHSIYDWALTLVSTVEVICATFKHHIKCCTK